MTRFKRYLTALNRYRKGKGFGIHSPFAFRFVQRVLKEHDAYYAYGTIAKRQRTARMGKHRNRHICSLGEARLLFRVVNFFNPSAILQFGSGAGVATVAALLPNSHSRIWLCELPEKWNTPSVKEATEGGRNRVQVSASAADNIARYKNSTDKPFVLIDCLREYDYDALDSYLLSLTGNHVVFISNLHRYPANQRIWEGIRNRATSGMGFTNGKIGIFVGNPKLPPQFFPIWL